MTHSFVIRSFALALGLTCLPVLAQERIFRCGNEYTNDVELAKSRGCKPMDGGNITIIQAVTPARAADGKAPRATGTAASPRAGADRVDAGEQRARDSDARAILESELRKAQERLEQAQKAYANGAPEKEGIEFRNYQRYQDRVAELKANVVRAESDVAGIQRELGRMGGASGAAAR